MLQKPDTLNMLVTYIVDRKSLATAKNIATQWDKESREQIFLSDGMQTAYNDILNWLKNNGIEL